MTVYIALLRGINVGGRNRLAMADLRGLLADLGHREPRTYLQSGNAVFTSDRQDSDALAAELAARISSDLGVSPAVIVRTAGYLADVASANPYADAAAADPTRVHVAFLSAEPEDPEAFSFDAEQYSPEEMARGDRVLYLHLPGGLGRSRLAEQVSKPRSDLVVTLRNWRTVARLRDMGHAG